MYVVFATPCLSHRVTQEYLLSALRTNELMVRNDIGHEFFILPGDPFIDKARSSIACDFLANPEATDLFFLDDDIGWPAEKTLEFLQRDEPVVAGVYPQRQDELNFPCSLEAGPNGLVEQNNLFKAIIAPTGFMRIKRWVLEKLWTGSPEFWEDKADHTRVKRRAIFQCGPAADGLWWGEDSAFCNTCRQLDIGVWIDPDIPFYHRGTKRFGAKMGDSMHIYRQKAALAA